MTIVEMSDLELKEAVDFMNEVPTKDPNFSGWNFDEGYYKSKFKELLHEVKQRSNK